MYDVVMCGGQGLAAALAEAARTVEEMGEKCIVAVAEAPDPDAADCYWVYITYRPMQAEGHYYRRDKT